MARHVRSEPNRVAALGEVNHRIKFLSARAARARHDQHHTIV
jgi:hypothetical protein